MRWRAKREILPFIIVISFVILSILFYPTLPERVPSHFDAKGMPDKFSPKLQLMLSEFGSIMGLYLILTFVPLIDPFWKRIQKKYNIFLLFRDLALLFFLFFYIITIIAAKRGILPPYVLGIAFGLLFVLLGNYIPKLPRNFFFGIRSPWTLASETVWKKTHILGGWVFVAAGMAIVALSFLGVHLGIALLITLAPSILFIGILYPFFLYRQLQKDEKTRAPEL
ncbi:MAG: SdpI family protein [Candidatus Zixiibacteriota bacterium]